MQSVIGILVALLLASGMALAGGSGGSKLGDASLFALCGLLAFAIQWLAFIPAFAMQTERFYDLTGSLTYILLALMALLLATPEDVPRVTIGILVMVWACRLGSFLFLRIRQAGEDRRFRHIKPHFLRFLMTWTLQGLWVFITFAAGLAAILSGTPAGIDAFTVVGLCAWLLGFAIEVVADGQKSRFRADPANREKFISHGLWRYSRHPNYFGEILLWTGIAIMAFPMLSGWQYLTLVSPLFVYLLLTRVSGVSMLEASGSKRWGDDPAYREYCERTPVLFLNPLL
ncbi:MAG: DUF1295 domain-containing protein [Halieaceae bacterium]|nr:DUF1295 domain-containing protein [Halieaceae bacterium]